MMRPIEHWTRMPSAAGKAARHVGRLRATYAHATAYMRGYLAYNMPETIWLRPVFAHSRVLGAQLLRPERQHPAAYARRFHQNLNSAGTCAPAQHSAMCHVSPAFATYSVRRSAPGASSPQISSAIVGVWPFAAAVHTLVVR